MEKMVIEAQTAKGWKWVVDGSGADHCAKVAALLALISGIPHRAREGR